MEACTCSLPAIVCVGGSLSFRWPQGRQLKSAAQNGSGGMSSVGFFYVSISTTLLSFLVRFPCEEHLQLFLLLFPNNIWGNPGQPTLPVSCCCGIFRSPHQLVISRLGLHLVLLTSNQLRLKAALIRSLFASSSVLQSWLFLQAGSHRFLGLISISLTPSRFCPGGHSSHLSRTAGFCSCLLPVSRENPSLTSGASCCSSVVKTEGASVLGTGGRGHQQPGRLQLRPLLSLMVGNMSGNALLLDNCFVYDAISGTDSKDCSQNVCHGQRVAALEDEFETLTVGSFLISFLSLLSYTSLLPSSTFLPTYKFPLSKVTTSPFLFSVPQFCQI